MLNWRCPSVEWKFLLSKILKLYAVMTLMSTSCSFNYGLKETPASRRPLTSKRKLNEKSGHFFSLNVDEETEIKAKKYDPPIAQRISQQKKMRSLFYLNAATLIWGTQHSVLKSILELGVSPATINSVRFLVGAIILTAYPTPSSISEGSESNGEYSRTILSGAELGVWSFLGFALQSVGLMYTTVDRSAFLLYLNVKIVPVLSYFIFGRRSPLSVWISAVVAVIGTVILCGERVPPNLGDFWSLLAAASSAMYILRVETHASSLPIGLLTKSSLWTAATLNILWSVVESFYSSENVEYLNLIFEGAPSILYLGIIVTALTSYMQAYGQQHIGAERAALIFALDPVYASFFAYVFLGETLGIQGICGAGMITAAALYQIIMFQLNNKSDEET